MTLSTAATLTFLRLRRPTLPHLEDERNACWCCHKLYAGPVLGTSILWQRAPRQT